MKKKLFFLRHGKSDWHQTDEYGRQFSDLQRPLSRRGIRAASNIRDYLKGQKFEIDLVEYSIALRARMTFDIIMPALKNVPASEQSDLYTFNHQSLIEKISKTHNQITSLMIIGHNPAFQDAIVYLTDPKSDQSKYELILAKYPTAALAILKLNIDEWKDLKWSCGSLSDLVTPRNLGQQ